MAENTEKAVQKTQKTQKKSWFEGMKAEFKTVSYTHLTLPTTPYV